MTSKFENALDRAVRDINADPRSRMQDIAKLLGKNSYPTTSRLIDVGAFLVLAGALFMPIVRLGLRTLQLVDTDSGLVFGGAALAGLLAALIRCRWIAVISALVYGGLFALFIIHYYQAVQEMKESLKDNPFRGLASAIVGLEWGCVVITLCVLAVLCSTAIVRRA